MIHMTTAQREILGQFMRFGIIGAVGFLFDNALVYSGIGILGLGRIAAGLISFPFVVTLTWIGNRLFTFRQSPRAPLGQQFLKFFMVCGAGLVFNRGTYSLLVSHVALAYDYPVLGLLAGTAVGMFFNFFVARRLVFR